jgi:ATP-dependent RNA circularization protein (DNA/RNA ligase family)
MEPINTKYPRTYHLPWSPGTTSDDRKLSGDWFKYYKGKEIVITEKLDGENNMVNHYDVFARSHGAPTRSAWTRNMWSGDGIWSQVYQKIADCEEVYGENLFGEHSIHYDKLPSYYHIFAVRNDEKYVFYSWDDVVTYAEILGLPTVPVLWRGVIESEEQLAQLVDKFVHEPSVYGPQREGVVIRIADEFPIDEFSHYVCKWVRPGHVQTGEHWTKNWKRAKLIWEYKEEDGNI